MNDEYRSRSKNTLIRVTFDNGESICYKKALTTFLETLKRIPTERYEEIDLTVGNCPLLSRTIMDKYKDCTKPLGKGWYVITQSDSTQKYLQLKVIISKLNLDFKIELGYDFPTINEKEFKHKKTEKQKLLIKLKDGDYIAGETTAEAYINTLERIGFEVLMRKNIMISAQLELVTRTPANKSYVEVGQKLYVYMPTSTTKKAKILNVVNAYCKAGIEVIII